MSEMYMQGRKAIGLSRHMDDHGSVAYVISDQHGSVIQSKFFDSEGKPVQKNDKAISFEFLRWICDCDWRPKTDRPSTNGTVTME